LTFSDLLKRISSAGLILIIVFETFNFEEIFDTNFEVDIQVTSLMLLLLYIVLINALPQTAWTSLFEIIYISTTIYLLPKTSFTFFLLFIPLTRMLKLEMNRNISIGISLLLGAGVFVFQEDITLAVISALIFILFTLESAIDKEKIGSLNLQVEEMLRNFEDAKMYADEQETKASVSHNLFRYRESVDLSTSEEELLEELTRTIHQIFSAEVTASYVFIEGKYELRKVYGNDDFNYFPKTISKEEGDKTIIEDEKIEHAIRYEGESYIKITTINKHTTFDSNKRVQVPFESGDKNILEMLETTIEYKVNEFKSKHSLEIIAYYDHLTRLPKRLAMETIFFPDLYQKAYDRGVKLYAIIFDIDDFKQVNDTHGHSAGDEVLRKLGDKVQQYIDEEGRMDKISRWGGEEFAGLILVEEGEDIKKIAEGYRKMIKDIETPFGKITVSVGLCEMELDESYDSLVDRMNFNIRDPFNRVVDKADEALYKAKETGKDRVVFYEEIEEGI